MVLRRSAAQRSRDVIVGIDAGNVDVRVAIAAMHGDAGDARDVAADAVRVLGFGVATAQGIRRGEVVDARRLGAVIRAAVAQAEQAAGHRVLGAYFSIPLGQLHGGVVSQRSGRLLLSTPAAVREMTHRAIEHAPVWQRVAAVAGVEIVGIVPSVLAASAAVMPPDASASGVVVECGAEHTSVAIFVGGSPVSLGVIPVGGDHITRDLAAILNITPMEAERLKFEVANVRANVSEIEVLVQSADGSRTSVSVALIAAIITARVDQILRHVNEMVRPALASSSVRDRRTGLGGAVGEVVICGGGATLSGMAQMTRTALAMPVRIAGAWGVSGPAAVQSPAYAPVLGLLRWRMSVDATSEMVRSGRRVAAVGAQPRNSDPIGVNMKLGQNRWQAWLREFLP